MIPYRPITRAAASGRARLLTARRATNGGSSVLNAVHRSLGRPYGRSLGLGVAVLLLLGVAWQPMTAAGAPVGQGGPINGAPRSHDPLETMDDPSSANGVDATMAVSATTTSITSDSPDPSTVNQGYTVAATVGTAVGTPTGTVTVVDGTGQSCAFTVPPLSGSCVLTSLTAGAKTLVATYGGDATFFGSSSAGAAHTVNKASTSVSLSSSLNPAERTLSVVFTATVNESPSGAANPTGMVNFFDGVTFIGSGPVGAGNVATFATSSLSVGSHSITAQYAGDANFNGSTSGTLTQVITKSPTSTTLTASPNPSKFGEYVVLTAVVANTGSGTGTPDGLVNFKDGVIPIGSGFLDGTGTASIAVCNLTVATHSLTAAYGGSADFLGSTSSAVSQVVNKDDTMASVSSSVNPSVFGELITLSATVVGVSPCSGTPTGTVTFKDGATVLSSAALSSGSASFLLNSLSVASHSITVVYNGSAQHNTVTSPVLTQVVNKAATTTALSSSTNPSVYGQNLTLSASVTANPPGNGFPSGTVDFKDITGATTLCSPSGLSWSCGVSSLPVGSRTLRADYGGDGNFLASNSATVTQVVNKADTTTTIVDAVNPTVFGQSTTFTATVAAVAPGAGTRTGTIQFKDGASNLGPPIALSAAFKAAVMTSTLSIGTHSITAVYSGDGNFNGSTSAATNHVVNKASTTTVATSAPNPSSVGQSVTITGTVTVNPPGTGSIISPTGTVTFKDGPTTIGTGTLAGGVATMMTSAFALGSHLLTIVYPGDSNYDGGTSAPYNHTVGVASTTTSLTQDSTTTVYGQNVGLTATVTSTGGTPIGAVTFLDGGSALGSSALAGGMATLNTAALTAGVHTLTAVYNGNANFNASASGPITHTVNKANTTTTVSSSVNPTVFGQSTTFTANVSPVAPGAGTRTGTVDFKDGVTTIGSGAVNAAGQATFSTALLSVGAHAITAVYNGDSNFNGSTGSLPTHTVNPANTTTTVTSNSNPSASGASVTFTASVTPVAPGAGVPSGTVTFKDGATTIGGPIALVAGMASFSTSSLSVGSHNITAVYNGAVNFNASTSAILVQVVTLVLPTADFSVVKTDSPDPVRAGDNVTYLISATNNSAGAATVTMTDTLPSLVGLVSFSAPGWSCSTPPGKLVCTKTVAAGATDVLSAIVSVPGTLAAGTVLINTATVAGGGGTVDPNPNNDTSTARTTVYRTRRFGVTFE